ncbi:MAG: hypothetical protein ACRD10_14615, partial [Terriglobia bacterium]
MNRPLTLPVLIFFTGVTVASAGVNNATITGRVVITKVLTKKRVTLPVYQLRGVSPGPQEPEHHKDVAPGIDELSRVVIYLEGPGLGPSAPVNATLTQKN